MSKHIWWRLRGLLLAGLFGKRWVYFLVLPARDFTSWVKAEARYSDSAACGRVLFESSLDASGRSLLPSPLAARFWTEQADRCTLVSLAACIDQLNAEWFEELGRWASRMSSRYIRTHIYRVRLIQRTVALQIRSNRYEPALFNEEEVFTKWAAFLCSHGLPQDDAVRQVTALMDYAAAASMFHSLLALPSRRKSSPQMTLYRHPVMATLPRKMQQTLCHLVIMSSPSNSNHNFDGYTALVLVRSSPGGITGTLTCWASMFLTFLCALLFAHGVSQREGGGRCVLSRSILVR